MIDGDPDPISAGTAGDAALWGGSSAAVGMAANPFGAHQAGLHRRPRDLPIVADHDVEEGAPGDGEAMASSCSAHPLAAVCPRLQERAR